MHTVRQSTKSYRYVLSLSLSLSHTHTHTHARARLLLLVPTQHTHTRACRRVTHCVYVCVHAQMLKSGDRRRVEAKISEELGVDETIFRRLPRDMQMAAWSGERSDTHTHTHTHTYTHTSLCSV